MESASFLHYRWLLKGDPMSRTAEIGAEKSGRPNFPNESNEWPAFVLKYRGDFEEEWSLDTVARDWVTAMADHPPEAIFPPEDAEVKLDFRKVRRLSETRWATAQLLLIEGRNEEAAELLLPLLRACYHLQQGSTSLLTQMVALVCLRRTCFQLELILDSRALSPTVGQKLAVVLSEASPVSLTIDKVFLGERLKARSELDLLQAEAGDEDFTRKYGQAARRLVLGFTFNRNRSEREHRLFLEDARNLALHRQLDRNDELAINLKKKTDTWHMKNSLGQFYTRSGLPSYWHFFETLWKSDDQRSALIKRLEK